jgi:glyoxylase-like metal-dependent hydrolase (beta-lactamase superfamily II)
MTDSRDGCVYLLNLDELILIDSGAGWSVDQIEKNIRSLGFDCSRLARVILTHCHIDHIGGAPLLRNRFGSQLCIHELDAIPVECGDPTMTAATWYQTTFPPTPIDFRLHSPETIAIEGENVICLHTPGHTPGSISVYLDRDGKRILFAQDLHGPLIDEFGSNLDDWGRSTQKLLDLQADILCEGHFGIYSSKKKVKEYIMSYRRHYGVE